MRGVVYIRAAPGTLPKAKLVFRVSSKSNASFTRLLHPQGCAQSLQKWLHNNIISIVGICLGVGLLEVT